MSNQTYYVQPENIGGDQLTLTQEESRHIIKVLRKQKGDAFLATDGAGTTYECQVDSFAHGLVTASILSKDEGRGEPEFQLILAVALLKKDRFKWIIEKGTELGISNFMPIVTERTIGTERSMKPARCRKIAISAMKQSGRSRLPEIADPMTFHALLNASPMADVQLIAHEKDDRQNLDDVLHTPVRSAVLCVGPEGGFTEEEVIIAREHGYRNFRMGIRRLRTETAAITAAALVMHKMGELT
ncbi:MAG: RsmE family RNA methyltransferase [Calditrichaeota bacterium]|nr:RsmE family RNA methyltransferase [Calditrichota bacterium]